jgi:hypothetical protein
MKKRMQWVSAVAVVLFGFAGQADVVTNILQIENMTHMTNGAFFVNENGGLFAASSDFKSEPNSTNLMVGYGGPGRRGMAYTDMLSLLGVSDMKPGTYTMTLQVAMDRSDRLWVGQWDTVTTNYDRGDGGFSAAIFTEIDSLDRVAYTMDSVNAFNLMDGVNVTVTSDPLLDVLSADTNIPPALTEDTWYDVVWTWEVSQEAADTLSGQPVYVGFGMATGPEATSLWMANSQLTYEPPNVITNVLRIDEMTRMTNGAVFVNNNGGFYAANSDFKSDPNSANLMMGYGAKGCRAMAYTDLLDVLGSSSFQAGTYTMTLQVGMNVPDRPWVGQWDTVTTNYNRTAGGFAGAIFTEVDASDRVAFTMDSANNFNLMTGVTVTVTSDPAVNVLLPDSNIPPALAEDTWYDVVYTWEVSQEAADALDEQSVYVGFGMSTGDEATSLWMANARLVYTAPEANGGTTNIPANLSFVMDGSNISITSQDLSSSASNVLQMTESLVPPNWVDINPYSSGTDSNTWTVPSTNQAAFFRIVTFD